MNSFLKPTVLKRMIFFILIDTFVSLLTLYFSYQLRFNFAVPPRFLDTFMIVFVALTGLKISFMYLFKNYFIVWRFFSFVDAKNIIKAHLLAYAFFALLLFISIEYFSPFPRSVLMIDFFLSLIFVGAIRMSRRMVQEGVYNRVEKPTLILGVNSKTGMIIQSALKGDISYFPTAIVVLDDDKSTKSSYIQNIKVSTVDDLEELISKNRIESAIFTENLPADKLQTIVNKLNDYGIKEIKKIKILGEQHEKLEDISIEDLLARHPKDLDIRAIKEFITGKRILITGAGGSIGSEISIQCEKFGAAALVLVDHSEYNLYQIGETLPDATLRLLSITNQKKLEEIFDTFRPDIVIHAAAYKHVPICEENREVAIYNNIIGSKILIDTSIKYHVKKVVIISTDKAVRPTNVMGATKRVTELYAANVTTDETEIVAVRFGNVLGSSGSVIPKFKALIEAGEPLTVTHPDITRYFMLISEACKLVLQTATIAKGGELFVLDMGKPIKIVDLANQMIQLYGKSDEIDIVFTGLRAGEKLYEELLLDESERETQYSSIFVAAPTPYEIEKLKSDIAHLLLVEDKISALQTIVPEFTHAAN